MTRPNLVTQIEREMRRPQKTRGQIWRRRITLGIFLLAIPAILAEAALRAFSYSRPQIDPEAQLNTMQQAVDQLNQRYQTQAFIPNTYLLWTLKPGGNFGGLPVQTDATLNYPGDAPTPPKSAKPLRVLCLGDHVTATGYWTFPHMAQRLAQSVTQSSMPLQIENAAVPGYSTEQVLRLWKSGVLPPADIVLIGAGWADQSPALNLPDHDLGFSGMGGSFLHRLLSPLRLYQISGASLGARAVNQPSNQESTAASTERVPPEAFRQNLMALISEIKSAGSIPVLSTQPWSEPPAASVASNLETSAPARQNDKIETHLQYMEIVRQVASATQSPLMDLEAEFLRRRRDQLMQPDGVHLTPRGHNHVARLLLALLRDEGHIARADYDAIAQSERHDTASPDKPRVVWNLLQEQIETTAGQTIAVTILAQNAGNTRWLKKHTIARVDERLKVSHGTTYIAGRWITEGVHTSTHAAHAMLPSDILPGEATSVTLNITAPAKPGNYQMEIGLTADQIGELKHYGAETTTLTLVAW